MLTHSYAPLAPCEVHASPPPPPPLFFDRYRKNLKQQRNKTLNFSRGVFILDMTITQRPLLTKTAFHAGLMTPG